jgi:hypothetical protein
MRLSKKGWNNVLIFGVLLVIFIFNFSQDLRLSSPVNTQSVISPDVTILEIQTPDYVISRNGRQWAQKPSVGLSSENLQQLVNNWQSVPLAVLTEQKLVSSTFVLRFFVAEQIQPIIVQLHQLQNEQYILQVNEHTFLSLPIEKLTLFLGK